MRLIFGVIAGESPGHQAQHERQHLPQTVQGVEPRGCADDQGRTASSHWRRTSARPAENPAGER